MDIYADILPTLRYGALLSGEVEANTQNLLQGRPFILRLSEPRQANPVRTAGDIARIREPVM